MLSLARSGLLVACVAFVACVSAPDPKTSASNDDSGETSSRKKKKKKKKKRKRTGVFGKKDVANADDESKDESTPKDEDRRDDEKDDDDEVRIVDDSDIEPEPKKAALQKPKKKAKDEVAPKKKKNKELDDDAEEIAAKQDENVETKKDVEDDTDEVAAKPKKKGKKTAVVAAKSKKKATAEEDIPEIELDTPPIEEPEPTRAKAKRSEPEPDEDEGDVIDMEALAKAEAEDDPLAERRVAAIAVPGVDDDSDDSDEEEPEPLAPGAWPKTLNDRPLVLAKGKAAAHAGIRYAKVTVPDGMGTPQASTAQSLTLGGTYGLGDKLEVGFDYALGVSPGTIKGPFTLHAAYRAKATPKLELAVAGGFAVDFLEITGAPGTPTTSKTNASLQLGAWARYRINRKASLFTGVPATPASPATIFNGVPANPMSPVNLAKLPISLPPQAYHLAVGLNNTGAIAFDMPVGLGYQITPDVYGYGVLNLAHLAIANTDNAFLFKDFIQVGLGGFYTRKTFDVGLVFADDFKQGTDYLRLDLLARYYIK